MLRKVIGLVIIASMIVHCCGRLGVLSYLYKKRHEIAFAAGIITEVPIALCSSEYNFSHELTVESPSDADQIPPYFLNAQEINLFFASAKSILSVPQTIASKNLGVYYSDPLYTAPTFSIFHPPSA